MSRVIILGVGPGDSQYMTLRGVELVRQADVVAGFKTVLATADPWISGERLVMDYKNQEDVLARVGQAVAAGKRCVVCAAGDPSVSARELVERVRRACGDVEIVPGISSIQMAAALAGIPFEESLFLTLHKRAPAESDVAELATALQEDRRHLIVLPRPFDLMPADIARRLLAAGVAPSRGVRVYEELARPAQRARSFTLGELAQAQEPFSDLSVLVFPK
ncbi:MAG: precorrin-6y C5,15-methyltransferase (decarboxylating) subunit CbiE [Chloroflexi bacterium]|nr:precorrin-6y C5,15-methyltransferase (decarboxylating) subunit CbiE [Chloroflexota bacterium]